MHMEHPGYKYSWESADGEELEPEEEYDSESSYGDPVSEIVYQVQARRQLAEEFRDQVTSSDPICSLPLTDYQRGLLDARISTLAFMSEMVKEVREKQG